ncbi:hypothetical protein HanPI659440_Chr11g0440851 [Helianthus annuus]|nr:hypothetical protein HanPI659440_Chr11g0440851 [Helianthus annuus]
MGVPSRTCCRRCRKVSSENRHTPESLEVRPRRFSLANGMRFIYHPIRVSKGIKPPQGFGLNLMFVLLEFEKHQGFGLGFD